MKKLFLILTAALNTLAALSQTTTTTTTSQTRKITMDQTTVVKDSAGVVKPYSEWIAMMRSGKYRLLPVDPAAEKIEFKIVSRNTPAVVMVERPGESNPAAQTALPGQAPARRITANENSVVKDPGGIRLPFVIWQKMVNSAEYWLKPIDPTQADPEFMLVAYTEEQKANMYKNWPRPKDTEYFTTGQTFKSFKFRDSKGQKIDAKDWAGKTVVINFWFIDCPPCRAEIPDLNKLALKYKDNPNVIFVAVALDQYWEVTDFVKNNPLAYHLVGDGRTIAHSYDITTYPTNVVVSKEGKVMLHYTGGYKQGPYWMDKMIQESEGITAEK